MTRRLRVSCPTCQAEVPWSEANPWRPFCSERCKRIDLGDWASNRFVIAASETPEQEAGLPETANERKQ